jgi:hypothetical protein
MADNVIDFTGVTLLDTPPPKVLEYAARANLQDVVVLGWDDDGNLYFASSSADGAEVNWLLDSAKQELLEAGRK